MRLLTMTGLTLFLGSLLAIFLHMACIDCLLKYTISLGVVLVLGPSCIGAWHGLGRKWYW